MIDGENVEMPDGFPSFAVQGSKKLFSFRIPKFNKTALIDPTSSLGGSEGGGDVSGGDGGDSGGDGDSTTPMPTSPGGDSGGASLQLPFNMCVLALLLHVTTMFTVPF